MRTSAKDLYVSSRFQFDRTVAAQGFDQWYILSGRHGLLAPDVVVEPYDFDLMSQSEQYKQHWGNRVASAIYREVEGKDSLIEIRASRAYRDPLVYSLRGLGFRSADDIRDDYVLRLVRCEAT